VLEGSVRNETTAFLFLPSGQWEGEKCLLILLQHEIRMIYWTRKYCDNTRVSLSTQKRRKREKQKRTNRRRNALRDLPRLIQHLHHLLRQRALLQIGEVRLEVAD
jgi:hypothetical protein